MDDWSDGEQRDLSGKLLRKAQRYANDSNVATAAANCEPLWVTK